MIEVIKKYNNRKLYSTKLSSYVDLKYILDLVRTGQKFTVIKSKSNEDITTDIMKNALSLVPIKQSVLETLIKGCR